MAGPTYTESLQRVVDDYRSNGQTWPATARQIAAWAIYSKRWTPQADTLIGQCADHLARAMREEYITDPQGRTVRAKHAARFDDGVKQGVLWDDIRTASRDHMEIAFQQRRQQIVGDCRQLKSDVDSFNDNKNAGPPIQLILDFTDDVAELEALSLVEA